MKVSDMLSLSFSHFLNGAIGNFCIIFMACSSLFGLLSLSDFHEKRRQAFDNESLKSD